MNNNKIFGLLTISAVLASSCAFAAQTQGFQPYVPNYGSQSQYLQQQPVYNTYQTSSYVSPLQGRVVMIPPNVAIPAVTSMELSTEQMIVGQGVNIILPEDFSYSGVLVAPAGSMVNGTAVIVKKASFASRNGEMLIRFNSITTPYGQTIPISAKIKTDDGTGVIKGGTKVDVAKEYAKDIGVGAAGGAVMGTIMGPLSGGKVGKGAAMGTAVGATAGLAKSLVDKGGNVVIPANSRLEIILDQPISYTPTSGR